jgi:hypothetical protein
MKYCTKTRCTNHAVRTTHAVRDTRLTVIDSCSTDYLQILAEACRYGHHPSQATGIFGPIDFLTCQRACLPLLTRVHGIETALRIRVEQID